MKSQAAVETLLIYGVAILVVMLAIGALIGFGVLDLGSLLPDKCEISGVAIDCSDYLIEPGNVQLQLRNSIGKNINVYNVTIEGEDDSLGLWGTNCSYSGLPGALPGSQEGKLIINGEKSSFTLGVCDVKVTPGKKIKGKLLIRYASVGSNLVKTAYGSINAKVS
ncbi:MAG: hypothetical protein ABIJ34_00130 [archaeon]